MKPAALPAIEKYRQRNGPELPTGWNVSSSVCTNRAYGHTRRGGALGFDALAASTVIRLRRDYPDMKLILVLPCQTQTRGWRPEDVTEYERIKAQADEVFYTAQQYTRGCMHKRNRHMVDHSGVCVCYLTKDSGGTAYTVNYAKKQGLNVVNIAANTSL